MNVIDVEKSLSDLYNYQRQNISRYYELKSYIRFVEFLAIIALFIAIMVYIQHLSIENKLDEHMKNCNCKTVIEKGK